MLVCLRVRLLVCLSICMCVYVSVPRPLVDLFVALGPVLVFRCIFLCLSRCCLCRVGQAQAEGHREHARGRSARLRVPLCNRKPFGGPPTQVKTQNLRPRAQYLGLSLLNPRGESNAFPSAWLFGAPQKGCQRTCRRAPGVRGRPLGVRVFFLTKLENPKSASYGSESAN